MRRLFILFILIFLVELYAWEWIPFDKELSLPTKPTIKKLSSSSVYLSYSSHIPGIRCKTIETDWMKEGTGEEFVLFSFSNDAYTGEVGKPKLPVLTQVIEIPHGANVEVEILDVKYNEASLKDLGIEERIMPVLAPVPKIMGESPEFVIDELVYLEDNYYPYILSEVEKHEGFARGHKLATIRLFPVQYNPRTGNIRYYTDIEIEIRFVGGNIQGTIDAIHKNYSDDWESFIGRMVLNPDIFEGKDEPSLPIYYDIFYSSDFHEAAESLSLWKTQKGFKVRMWDATGWSASQIENTIDTQTPLPTYLLLIGDPNNTNPLPSGSASAYSGQTDLYYSEIDGKGYLPDLFMGRISVKTPDDAITVVRKTIKYEKADFGSAGYDWLKRATFIAGYDANWQDFTRATNRYCFNILVNNAGYKPFDVDTLVMAPREGESRVVDEINEGNIWTVYTGHGDRRKWSLGGRSGDFNVSELTNQTNNQDMYTMSFGYCCLSNDFDYLSDCFGETWPKLINRGGISYFGSVPKAFWDEDDWLQRRYFDAIYTDLVPGRLYEVSRFTQWALYWIENHTSTSLKQYYFEAYHVMNDPSLQIWTDIPDVLLVTHNSEVPPGSSDFTVEVYDNNRLIPIEGALVCCWIPSEDPDIHVVGYTNTSGSVTFNISPSATGQDMFVTVTKHDYLSIIDTVHVEEIPSIYSMTADVLTIGSQLKVMYTLPENSIVYFRVYDCAGREVKFIREAKEAGWYETYIDMIERPAGIYFISMEANGKRFRNKAVMIR